MKKATVLFSGGIDSTSTAVLLKSSGLAVRGLFVDYGQASRDMERKSIARLKDFIEIAVDEIQVSSLSSHGTGELVGRNALLIFSAVLVGNCDSGGIAIGIHSGTPYYDCSSDFAEKIDALVQQCSGGKLSILAPFVHWSKDDVYSYFLSKNLPLAETYSCEAGTTPACGQCASCLDRKRLECSLRSASSDSVKVEVERIRRVADQLCTAHAALRDRFAIRQLVVDIIVLLLSAWITSMGFVDPRLSHWLTPPHFDAQLWIGLLGSITFGLTLVQFKADWRGRSEAHQRSFTMYAEVKREAGYLLANAGEISARDFQRLADRYDMASDVGTDIPEKDFLALKRHHKLKVAVSRLLDANPGSSIWLTKIKLILRDNWK